MSGQNVVETLRHVRGTSHIVAALKAESLEARAEKIATALASPNWDLGPATLLATYSDSALIEKDGSIMTVQVVEDGGISFGKIEVHQMATPPDSIGREVMETALAAVDKMYENDISAAEPMIAAIANAVYTSGDLKRRIMAEVAKRSINRQAWWHKVVSEQLEKMGVVVEEGPTGTPSTYEELLLAVDDLRESMVAAARKTALAISALADEDVEESIEIAARDIAADLKYVVEALAGVDRNDPNELTSIYEGVRGVANQLRAGARFLESLAGNDGSDNE